MRRHANSLKEPPRDVDPDHGLPTYGRVYSWEFEKDGREVNVRVDGQLVFNNLALRLDAALSGLGLAYLPEDRVQPHIDQVLA
jgi:DNA-binding transcriptional LysR family regulator